MKTNKNHIPFDTTPVSICRDCGQQIIAKYSMRKDLVRWKYFNLDGTKHQCKSDDNG